MKVMTQKKCKRGREIGTSRYRTWDNLRPIAGFQQPKLTNQAGTIHPSSPYMSVRSDVMAQPASQVCH